jgi:ketosteroid isomerase-like protein
MKLIVIVQFLVYAVALICAECRFASRGTLRMIFGNQPPNRIASSKALSPKQTIELYFDRWNKRDMDSAADLFDADCVYEDTLYPGTFRGREAIKSHLLNVAASLPGSFSFVIDDIAEDILNGKVGVQWHVESENKQLPFTRGSSMYTISKNGKILKGFDVPEPVAKTGSASLALLKFALALSRPGVRFPSRPHLAFVLDCVDGHPI